MFAHRIAVALFLFCVYLGATGGVWAAGPNLPPPSQDAHNAKPSEPLAGPTRLIVQLRGTPLSLYIRERMAGKVFRQLDGAEMAAVEQQAERLAATRRALLGGLQAQGIAYKVTQEYGSLFQGLALSLPAKAEIALRAQPGVVAVYPDRPVRATLFESVPLVGAPAVWGQLDPSGQPLDGHGVRIALLDTGADYTHPDLGGGLGPGFKVVGGYDLVNDDADPQDDNGHGTHVAGIVAANGALKGVAPNASLFIYKVLDAGGGGYDATIIAGLERAADPDGDPLTDDGAQVINLSLGGYGDPDDPLCQAVDAAVAQGIVVVAAAGNAGSAYYTVLSPSMARGAIAVAATDKADQLAAFSSRGPVTDFFDLLKPDLAAPGSAISATLPCSGTTGCYGELSGTSMAAPHVAGAAALLRQLHPTWAPSEIKANLLNTARPLAYSPWQVGAGRLAVDDAAQAPLLVMPSSLALGLMTAGETRTADLVLTKLQSTAISATATISLTRWSDPYLHTLEPPEPLSAVSLDPGQVSLDLVGNATLTARVQLPADVLDGHYVGAVTIACDGQTLRVPLAFSVLSRFYPPDPNDLVSQFGGEIGPVAVRGNYAYVGVGGSLVVLDVSDPAHLQVAGKSGVLRSPVADMAFAGDQLYLVDGVGLVVMDLTDPTNPVQIGNEPGHTWGSSTGVATANGYAYVADWTSLRIYDISNPRQPVEVGEASVGDWTTGPTCTDVTLAGSHAFLSLSERGLAVVDVADPHNPVQTGSLDTAGVARGVAAAGSTVYLATSAVWAETASGWQYTGGGLRSISVSDPAHPRQVGYMAVQTPYGAKVETSGGRAFLAMGNQGLIVIDVSNASNPRELGRWDADHWGYYGLYDQVALAGAYAYVGITGQGLYAVDVTNPAAPVGYDHYDPLVTTISGMARRGDTLYVAGRDRLTLLDIGDSAMPRLASHLHLGELLCDVLFGPPAIVGEYAYLAGYGQGLIVVNVGNPASPRVVSMKRSSSTYAHYYMYVAAYGRYAYLQTEGPVYGLCIMDVGDPTAPTEKSFYIAGDDQPCDMLVSRHMVYWLGRRGPDCVLRLIDASNPSAPVQRAALTLPGGNVTLSLLDNTLYVVNAGEGLFAIDVSSPAAPFVSGFYPTLVGSSGLAVAGNVAVMPGNAGARVVDLASYGQPQQIISYRLPCGLSALQMAPSSFLGATNRGVFAVKYAPNATYSVSGQVTDAQGRPVAGVRIVDTIGNLAISGQDGRYTLENLMPGLNVLVVNKPGATLSPVQRTVRVPPSVAGIDFQATTRPLLAPENWRKAFGSATGGWTSQETLPRLLGDVNGDGLEDVVGFGASAVLVSLSTGNGFAGPAKWLDRSFTAATGWTTLDVYPRLLADVNGDGRADIIGFGYKNVFVSLSTGTGFAPQQSWLDRNLCRISGWSSQNVYPRLMADLNGDGKADILGFGDKKVFVSLSSGSRFEPQQVWLDRSLCRIVGWSSQDVYPRMLADVDGDGRADIVGFGSKMVCVARSTGTGFAAQEIWRRNDFCSVSGWNRQSSTPRFLADISGDGRADIVGISASGVSGALSDGASFGSRSMWLSGKFSPSTGWTSQNATPRTMARVSNDHQADLVGFGATGVLVAVSGW